MLWSFNSCTGKPCITYLVLLAPKAEGESRFLNLAEVVPMSAIFYHYVSMRRGAFKLSGWVECNFGQELSF